MTDNNQRISRRQKKLEEKKTARISNNNFTLESIFPKTENQRKTFEAFEQDKNLVLLGVAGSGKTFISIYLAMKEIFSKNSKYDKLIIIRNPQSSKNIGFLPGDEKKKLEVYEPAYKSIFTELFGREDAYECLKRMNMVEFCGTSFLRGTTIRRSIVLIDEIQNQTYQELRTVITRLDNDSRLLMCGDTKQDDLTSERYKEVSGLPEMLSVFKLMESIEVVYFQIQDIVRGGLVKDFIIAEERYCSNMT